MSRNEIIIYFKQLRVAGVITENKNLILIEEAIHCGIPVALLTPRRSSLGLFDLSLAG